MRVFYPISARLSDLVNDKAEASTGWMMLLSLCSIALLVLVLATLPSFEGSAADQQQEYIPTAHFNPAVHNAKGSSNIGKPAEEMRHKMHFSTQDYIEAHRCAQLISCPEPVKARQLLAAPIVLKASGDLYL